MQAVGYAVSEAGIRAPLYWYHDAGYFEEYLAHKKGRYIHLDFSDFILMLKLRLMGSFYWGQS